VPLYHRVRVRVIFGSPILGTSLHARYESPPAITRAIAEQVSQLLPRLPEASPPRVAEGPPARRASPVQQL